MTDDFGGWLSLAINVLFVAILGGALVYGTLMWRNGGNTRKRPRSATGPPGKPTSGTESA